MLKGNSSSSGIGPPATIASFEGLFRSAEVQLTALADIARPPAARFVYNAPWCSFNNKYVLNHFIWCQWNFVNYLHLQWEHCKKNCCKHVKGTWSDVWILEVPGLIFQKYYNIKQQAEHCISLYHLNNGDMYRPKIFSLNVKKKKSSRFVLADEF